eukprot:8359322-Prorocentrum_lima.AAC.1
MWGWVVGGGRRSGEAASGPGSRGQGRCRWGGELAWVAVGGDRERGVCVHRCLVEGLRIQGS